LTACEAWLAIWSISSGRSGAASRSSAG